MKLIRNAALRKRLRFPRLILAVLFTSAGVLFVCLARHVFQDQAAETISAPTSVSMYDMEKMMRRERARLVDSPGIVQPVTIPGVSANLPDDAPVIGVVVEGQSRAYSEKALSGGPSKHVINDLIGSVPLSVTYCDITHCARAFTGRHLGVPLDLGTGGLADRQLLLMVGGQRYHQQSLTPFVAEKAFSDSPEPEASPNPPTPFPYDDYSCEQTTWKVWREEHPQTDLYVGEAAER
jgi:hypothetical protein